MQSLVMGGMLLMAAVHNDNAPLTPDAKHALWVMLLLRLLLVVPTTYSEVSGGECAEKVTIRRCFTNKFKKKNNASLKN